MLGGIGVPELIIILVIALLLFGPGKLPAVGAAVGKSIGEFKKAIRDVGRDESQKEKDKLNSGNGNQT